MKQILTKDTVVSLGAVMVIVGGIWWAATVDVRTRGMEVQVSSIPKMQTDVALIQQDIAFIKENLRGAKALSTK